MSAVVTPHVDITAHTPIHPLSVYARHGERRSEMQRVEVSSQPVRSRPTLGCLMGSGGEGSGVARRHDNHNTSRTCAPALRVFLGVAARVSDGQMDEQADQQRVHPAVRLPPPQFNGIQVTCLTSREQCLALQAELRELLLKEAIFRVPREEENQGYYSRYFLILKKTGGMRPILDLSAFNKAIMKRPFHMLTVKKVLECVHQGIGSPL
ncbi:hypothetical protein CgunFtcFv8_026514 [Champsocephalus gunnari]|uniref:Uncharacterized protein n=1 Tax=Champsocephalus gunnari TaxID=52237 RepID=A0AAN8DX69_CHAGU|nr:hypothetical protein CgunFtcFv8_026514 [Champsocephalus gunnari]